MSDVLQKMRKFKNDHPKRSSGTHTRGLYKEWKEGPNVIRLVGNFLEVKTHFIAPVPKRGDRGLCMSEAFAKDAKGRIPKVVNCPDWDVVKEESKSTKTCSICKLQRIARQALKEGPSEEEKKYFEALAKAANPRTSLKWNIFDRDEPHVTVVDENGNESKQLGLKIATFGMEAWDDIDGIFDQCQCDITDPDEGVDITVTLDNSGPRTSYSAKVVIQGKGVKVTPFSPEEKQIVAKAYDLKVICGKQTDMELVMNALHGDYREVLELNSGDATEGVSEGGSDDDVAAAAEEDTGSETVPDDDDVLGGKGSKKKR